MFYASIQDGGAQFGRQLYAVVITLMWSAVWTYLILRFVNLFLPIRVSIEAEEIGMDNSLHRADLSLNDGDSLNASRTSILFVNSTDPADDTIITEEDEGDQLV